MAQYQVIVIGTVERVVFVEADNLESAKIAADAEWAALTGGIVETAETVSAIEMDG